MTDSSQLVETLKEKAKLLIQRERELYALRLGRERMMGWLDAFHRLSTGAGSGPALSIFGHWTAVMMEERHFQTAAVFLHRVAMGELSLLHGQSHAPLPERVALEEDARRILHERPDGLFDPSKDLEAVVLARCLRLQCFVWHVFPHENETEILLVAGVAEGIGGAQGALSEDDRVYFTMLGRHLAVLLSNATLIEALGSATRNLQELFDHMRQAIVAFDASGTICGISSRQAKILFEQEALDGLRIRDLLYPGAPSYDVDATGFEEWYRMALGCPATEWASCEGFAPRELVLPRKKGVPISLELEFRPLVRDGVVVQLMLLASDVSVERKLEEAVQTLDAERTRRLEAMRRLIGGGTQVFLGFLDSARVRIDGCEAVLRKHEQSLPIEAIDELFRQVHTVRGEARSFELVELEAVTKKLEDSLDKLRDTARGAGHPPNAGVALREGLALLRVALEQECAVLIAASPAGAAVLDQVTVPRSALRDLVEYASGRSGALDQLVGRLTAVPLGTVAMAVTESVPMWVASQGNQVVLQVEPRELMVPGELARVLPGILAHLVRNSIAHGVEPPAERRIVGKPEQGTIRIAAEEVVGGIRLMVEDDGRGLDVARLRAQHAGAGDPSEIIFLPGVTTRDSGDELAGRGVGLDAVRSDLLRIHYVASVTFIPGRWTRFLISPEVDKAVAEGPLSVECVQ